MKRQVLWLLGLIGALALLWLGATVYVGGRVQQEYDVSLQEQSKELERLAITVRGGQYERGLFRSQAEAVYLDMDGGRTLCTLKHDIRHGPLLLGRRILGLASVQSHLVLPAGLRRKHRPLDGTKHPLTADSSVALDGSFKSRIRAPAAVWSEDGRRLSWSPVKGMVTLSRQAGQRLSMDFHLSKLESRASDDGEAVTFHDLELTAAHAQDRDAESGEQRMSLHVDRAKHLQGTNLQAEMESFSLVGQGSWSGSIMNSTTEFRFGSMQSGNLTLRQGVLEIRAENVNRNALQKLQALQVDPDTGAQGKSPGMAALRPLIKEMLRVSPAMEISRLQFRTKNGTVRLRGRIEYRHGGRVPLNDRAALIRKIEAEAHAVMPKSFAVRAVSLPMGLAGAWQPDGGQGGKGPVCKAPTEERARRWLSALRAMGFINEDDGTYASSAAMQAGVLSVNGVRLLDLAAMKE